MICWEVENYKLLKKKSLKNKSLSDQPKACDLSSRPQDFSCCSILAAKVIFRK